jgi:hypothetical protein
MVKVRPRRRGDPLKVWRNVFINLVKFSVSSGFPPRSGAPGYSQSRSSLLLDVSCAQLS